MDKTRSRQVLLGEMLAKDCNKTLPTFSAFAAASTADILGIYGVVKYEENGNDDDQGMCWLCR
jgi:hypothetical protein